MVVAVFLCRAPDPDLRGNLPRTPEHEVRCPTRVTLIGESPAEDKPLLLTLLLLFLQLEILGLFLRISTEPLRSKEELLKGSRLETKHCSTRVTILEYKRQDEGPGRW